MFFVRPWRIGLQFHPWQGRVLPLNYDRFQLKIEYFYYSILKNPMQCLTSNLYCNPKFIMLYLTE